MWQKKSAVMVMAVLLFSSLVAKSVAEEPYVLEKKRLIMELLELMETEKLIKDGIEMMLIQQDRNYVQIMSQFLAQDETLTDEQGKQLTKKIVESKLRFSQRLRELYPQRLNLQQLVEEVYNPLYSKYYTEAEIKDLIRFYKSPTGKKTVRITPQLLQESMQKSSEFLNPQIVQLINEILLEEKDRILQEIRRREQPEKL